MDDNLKREGLGVVRGGYLGTTLSFRTSVTEHVRLILLIVHASENTVLLSAGYLSVDIIYFIMVRNRLEYRRVNNVTDISYHQVLHIFITNLSQFSVT